MKKISMKIILVFFISLAFCSDDEKYTLQHEFDYGESDIGIFKTKHEQEVSFKLPGIGFVKYVTTFTRLSHFLGKERGFYKFKVIVTDMQSDNYVGGMKILDQYWLAMENRACYIYVKTDGGGNIDHIVPVEPEDAYLQEAFEAAYMSINTSRYKYPFGYAENIAVGDTWTSSFVSSKFYVNMGSPPSRWSSKAIWNLKKVKDKRGVKTAYIDVILEQTADLQISVDFLGERRLIVGNAVGKADATFIWDVENTHILYSRSNTSLAGDFEMDGKKFFGKLDFRQFSKMVE